MNFNTIALSKGFVLNQVSNVNHFENNTDTYNSICEINDPLTLAIQTELMHFGKMLDADAFLTIARTFTDKHKKQLANDIKSYYNDLYGDGKWHTLFGDFPNTVLNMSEEEMLIHTIVHYLSNGEYVPDAMEENSSENRDIVPAEYKETLAQDKFDMITIGNTRTLLDTIAVLLKSQQSLTQYDKDVISYIGEHYKELMPSTKETIEEEILDAWPHDIPFKETLCLVAKNFNFWPLKTTTDVLRLAVYMSGGDVALPSIPKKIVDGWSSHKVTKDDKKELGFNFKHFNRPERRLLLTYIENSLKGRTNAGLEEMKKYEGRWIRLGEILHPADPKNKKNYPGTATAFNILRNNANSIKTWNSAVENARKNGDLVTILRLYSDRPGEFARNLDWLLRTVKTKDERVLILNTFKTVADKVSIKMLYELIDHFSNRNKPMINRSVFIKGARRPTTLPDLPALKTKDVSELIQILCASIILYFSQKDSLDGQIYKIDKDLENIMLPENMRSMSAGVFQVSRGTKIPIPETKDIIRSYVHWIDDTGNEDLDLSASIFDENFKQLAVVSWNSNYKSTGYYQFSGDTRHRMGNCAEYIDVSIDGARKHGARYIVTTVCDFMGHHFNMPVYTGIMLRDKWGTPGSTSWAPNSVGDGIKIASNVNTNNLVLAIVDVVDMKFIVVDENMNGLPVATGLTGIGSLLKRYCGANNKILNGLKVVQMNIMARHGESKVYEHEDFVNELNAHNQKIESLNNEIKNTSEAIKLIPEDEISAINTLNEKLENLKSELDTEKKINFVDSDDIMKDYAKILDWMF